MKRLVLTVVGLALLGGLLLIPVTLWGYSGDDEGPADSDPTTITSYVADFDVADNGDLTVVETLTVDFPGGGRHGIFRFWDLEDQTSPDSRRIPHDIEVTMDGHSVPVEVTRQAGGKYRVARIGDPSSTVSRGEHVYDISYRIDGVLQPGTDGYPTQFYWNLIPAGWAQRIVAADLTVHLPVAGEDVQCAVGAAADCEVDGVGTTTLRVTAADLAPRTPVTLKAGLDMATPPAGDTLPWPAEYDVAFGPSVGALIAVLVLAVLSGLAGFLLVRRTHEDNPQFPLMYAPPEGIGPAQAAYLLTEGVHNQQYVATLMYAAEQGAIDLDRNGSTWVIADKAGPRGWAGLDPVTMGVAHLLGGPGTSFTASPSDVEAGQRLKTEIASFEDDTRTWATTEGLMVRSGFGGAGLIVIGLAALVTIGVAIWNPFHMTYVALIPGAFAILGAGLALPGAGTKRTRSGRELWSRSGGFKRILSTPSAQERFDFSGREQLYTAYVPWAVAFGCADEWAGKFRVETGSEPPTPSYLGHAYAGAYAGSAVSSMVSDFHSTLSSAISSYEATQKSSSSGGGGGGFSGGGGGGGGGGGSW